MSHPHLEDLFRTHSGMSDDDLDALMGAWCERIELKRGDFLIPAGKTEQRLYFITDGSLRIYYPTEEEEICVGFAYPGNILCSFPSFISGKPSEYAIQALKKSAAIAIRKEDFQAVQARSPQLQLFWTMQIEQVLVGRIDREIDLLLQDPVDRLQRLLARSPHIFQRIPAKYIASYLRMTPETLSRIHKS